MHKSREVRTKVRDFSQEVGRLISSISVGDSAFDMLITSFLISSPGLNGVYPLSLFIRKHLYKLKRGKYFSFTG